MLLVVGGVDIGVLGDVCCTGVVGGSDGITVVMLRFLSNLHIGVELCRESHMQSREGAKMMRRKRAMLVEEESWPFLKHWQI